MAVDKGSLDYRIRVTDAFSKPIAKFRADLLKTRRTARLLKLEIRGAAGAISKIGTVAEKAGRATKRLTKEELKKWRAIKVGATTATIKERLRSSARRDNLREEARLLKKANAEIKARAKVAAKAQAEQKRAAKAVATAAARATREQKRLNRALATTGRRGRGLIVTFKRLATVFIGFQALRFGAEALKGALVAGLKFNAVIESSRIGMAGLFATLLDISDVQSGKVLDGAEAFGAALEIADETLVKLRNRSLATAATFQELVTAFRAGFAPGVSAGLNIDETIFVTERFSQILTGLGIAQNQINEEIRSFLTATAQSRTSIIPTLFFGGAQESNRFVKTAKIAGDLFPRIQKRLAAFEQAAAEMQKSLIGTAQRLKGIFEVTAGQAAVVLFVELKDVLQDVSDVLAVSNRNAKGFIISVTPRKDTIAVMSHFFAIFTNIIKQVRVFMASFTGNEISLFIVTLGAAMQILTAIILGTFRGLITMIALAGAMIQKMGFAIDNLDVGALQSVAAAIAAIGFVAFSASIFFASWSVLFRLGKATLGGLTVAMSAFQVVAAAGLKVYKLVLVGILSGVQGVLFAIGKIPGSLFRALGVVSLLAIAFLEVTKAATGIELGFSDLPSVLGGVVKNIATKALALARIIAAQIKSSVIIAFLEVHNAAASFFEDMNEQLSIFRGDAAAQELNIANERAKVARGAVIDKVSKAHKLEIDLLKEIGVETKKNADALQGDELAKVEREIELRREAAEAAKAQAVAADEAAAAAVRAADAVSGDASEGVLASIADAAIALADSLQGLVNGDVLDFSDILSKAEDIAKAVAKAFETNAKPPPGGGAAEGYLETIKKGFKNAANEYAATLAIMKAATSAFSNFAANEIAIGLDPNREDVDGPSANERFKTFLDQIGKMIIQKLIELAIAKAIFSLAGGVSGASKGGGAARGGQIGFDEGGTVPGGKHQAAQFRPAQVAMSDTVPAWLTPGEFVNPVRSVLKYGADLFEGLRTGALDPAALREAAGLTNRRRTVKKIYAKGFAEGGPIGTLAAEARAGIQQQENVASQRTGPLVAPAMMVSDDQMMDRLMAGGQRQFRNWAEGDKEFFRGIVTE